MDVAIKIGEKPLVYIKKHDFIKYSDELPNDDKDIILGIRNKETLEIRYILAKRENNMFRLLEIHPKVPRFIPIYAQIPDWEIISWYEKLKFAKNTNTIMTKVN